MVELLGVRSPIVSGTIDFERATMIERLAAESFDVLVIGGGITGCGVALDAATRGLRTALVERDDFASGTSSKSSKLVHGGLRYLQQGDVRLVYEALLERQRLLRNAPHLVRVLPFLIPILTRDGPVSKRIAKALRSALWTYDLTGGARIGKLHRRLDADAALAACPTLPADRLSGAFVYYDAEADDARLTLTLARTAAQHGAAIANRCAAVELTTDADGTVDGAVIDCGDRRLRVRASVVVSATGVWADDVQRMVDPHQAPTLRPAKGIHVSLPWSLVRNTMAVIVSVPNDKRSLFVIPWGPRPDATYDRCYVGTTDTDYDGDRDRPEARPVDLDYVLRALNHSITPGPAGPITAADLTGVWAGLRPLVEGGSGRTADLSRRHRVEVGRGGLITVTGGKLTTYRKMAQDTVDAVLSRLGRSGRCRTRRLALAGAAGRPDRSDHLAGRYGSEAAVVRALIDADPSLGRRLVPGLAYLRAEAVYAVRCEMATTLDDVLVRRTRAHLFDREATLDAAADAAVLIAPILGWDAPEIDRQVAAYRQLCRRERDALVEGAAA